MFLMFLMFYRKTLLPDSCHCTEWKVRTLAEFSSVSEQQRVEFVYTETLSHGAQPKKHPRRRMTRSHFCAHAN